MAIHYQWMFWINPFQKLIFIINRKVNVATFQIFWVGFENNILQLSRANTSVFELKRKKELYLNQKKQ